MRPNPVHESEIVRQVYYCNFPKQLIQILTICIILHHSLCLCAELTSSSNTQQPGQSGSRRNANQGPLDGTLESTDSTPAVSSQRPPIFRIDRLSEGRNVNQQQQKRLTTYNGGSGNKQTDKHLINDGRRQEDANPHDCFAKRNEVVRRQSHTTSSPSATHRVSATQATTAGFQRLRPKIDLHGSAPSGPIVLNITLANNFDGEHVPRCRPDGSYDPVQCHKIGYCWCVNKFGQAIKNSAVKSGEEPECDPRMYESERNNRLVVTGISALRSKNVLNAGGSAFDSSTPNGNINFEATEPSTSESSETTLGGGSSGGGPDGGGHQQVEPQNNRLAAPIGHHGPVMPLIPNDCRNSRENARNRAETQVNDSIWVPECDNDDEKLYAEQQCHKSRVCWCVDQTTGLPLRTSEQLSTRPTTHNCAEIKKILGIASKPPSLPMKPSLLERPPPPPFYQGSSEYCDSNSRAEFVISLNSQFRQQISEYMRQNPTSSLPADSNTTNPYQMSELQVAKWKFNIMDWDSDGKMGDREWSKFKNNFKLVDKLDELDNLYKQQKSPYFPMTPLLIIRSQRKCWRDFLEFCGSGELVDESISLAMWLSCTEVPPKAAKEEQTIRNPISFSENTYALSREAAIVRSQKKNPFLGILKPD